jgi:hypothetical protein
MDLVDEGLCLRQRQGSAGAEELGLDAVESRLAVGPGIDRGVERGKFDGEDLRALIAGARVDPGLAGRCDVARLHGPQHLVGIGDETVDIDGSELLVLGRQRVELGLQLRVHPLAGLALAGGVRFGQQDARPRAFLGQRRREWEPRGRQGGR